MSAITMTDLTKKYGDLTAVDHVNLTIAEGELFACSVSMVQARRP